MMLAMMKIVVFVVLVMLDWGLTVGVNHPRI
jgi:hypothetical protein